MSPFDPDDILALAAQRAAGIKLSAPEQRALDRAMLDDPDLALLIVDAAEVAAATAPAQRKGRATLAALIFGMMACFGVGATAGAQLASGLVGGSSNKGPHQIEGLGGLIDEQADEMLQALWREELDLDAVLENFNRVEDTRTEMSRALFVEFVEYLDTLPFEKREALLDFLLETEEFALWFL